MKLNKIAFAVHGGAGNIDARELGAEKVKKYEASLKKVGNLAQELLKKGEPALEVVQKAVTAMEDNPLFNAGKGAAFDEDEEQVLDASIMDGKTGKSGAVAGVKRIKNPVLAARMVMDVSPHEFMIGEGAERFVQKNGMKWVEPSYFFEQKSYDQLLKAKQKGAIYLDHDKLSGEKSGTVGAVAVDEEGNLAAATSTGGMTNKLVGRIGDSPIIGAGTYACDIAAISCTGHGEFFIRSVVAYDVVALMKYKNLSLKEATEFIINKKLKEMKADGGLIAVDSYGNISTPFNSLGMFRTWGNAKEVNVEIN